MRTFAHQLRTDIWKKLFSITAGGKHAADHLKSAIEAPGSPASWRSIQAQAQKNAAAYEAVFPFVPRNFSGRRLKNQELENGSILSTWDSERENPSKHELLGFPASPMPFQSEFWSTPRHNEKAVSRLEEIKGFFTALPTEWTKGENIHIKFPATLVTKIDENTPEQPWQPTRTYVGSAEHSSGATGERETSA